MAKKATRASFGEAIVRLGEKNKDIVVLDADLSKSTKSDKFAKRFPDRFFDMGIAEANMVGTAAGLAFSGKVPFICSFSVFVTGRYDIIRMSIGYSKANVKIVGTHAGIAIGQDGNSQMALEDISIMRSIPNMLVIQPVDDIEAQQVVEYIADYEGPVFLRLTRQDVEQINPSSYKFEVGKGVILKDGNDVTIIATGGVVYNALVAAKNLEQNGISVRVVNIHTIKPIDTQLIIKCAKDTGKIFTIEDHNIIGGLGSAVCEVLSENYPVPVKRWGLFDRFGESGDTDELYKKYGFDADSIVDNVTRFVK